LHTRIDDGFWFWPVLYNALAAVAALLTAASDVLLDRQTPLLGVVVMPIDLSMEILSTLSVAILTMTAITFSTMMVVLSTYSTQFSPRVLQNFIADRSTQHVLAVFSAGFTFSLIALFFTNETLTGEVLLSPLVGVGWGLAGIAAFVYFIHHSSVWMRVNNLIGTLALETEKTVERVTTRAISDLRAPLQDEDRSRLERRGGTPIHAPTSGYVIFVDMRRLFEQARRDDAIVDMNTRIGAYIMEDVPVMTVYPEHAGTVDAPVYRDAIRIGDEQMEAQDVAFGLRKLVEIALRAISPSVTDPYTAAACVNRMTPILVMLAQRDRRMSAFYDQGGALRLVAVDLWFEDYLFRAFHEIRHYGLRDVTVITSIVDSLTLVARADDHDCHETLWQFGLQTAAAFDEAATMEASREYVRHRMALLAEATGRTEAYRGMQMLTPLRDGS